MGIFHKNKRKLFPHLFITIFVTSGMSYAVSSFIVLSLGYDPGLFPFQQILVQILILGSLPLVVMVEILLLLYGREIVAVANWGIALVLRLGLSEPIIENERFFAAFHKEILKVTSQNRQIDWCVISQRTLSIALPVGLTYGNIDPIGVILRVIKSEKLLNGPHLNNFLMIKVFSLHFANFLVSMQYCHIVSLVKYLFECITSFGKNSVLSK